MKRFSLVLAALAALFATAAIAGTKIAPNFGTQNIVTTGTISGNGSGLTNVTASGFASACCRILVATGRLLTLRS